ncbi:MAG: DUF951 domain-containing protein [Dehalococcoidia bacterium]|nr:DUF951 domain-containing protein [Dehalococcoidia bacterium]MDW8120112.1 DUF951 domain-containing protein [Chloroflexota bacterium]
MRPPLDIRVGDVLVLRKPHPCGGSAWEVYRVGADIGLRCQTCGRRVVLPRFRVEGRVKHLLRPAPGKPVPTPREGEKGGS